MRGGKVQVYDLLQAQRPGCRTAAVEEHRAPGPPCADRQDVGTNKQLENDKIWGTSHIWCEPGAGTGDPKQAAGLTVWWHRGAASPRPSRSLRTTVSAAAAGKGGRLQRSQLPPWATTMSAGCHSGRAAASQRPSCLLRTTVRCRLLEGGRPLHVPVIQG